MKPLTAFTPLVAYHAIGVADPTVERAVLDAAIAFCEDSMILRERLDTQAATAADVELDLPQSGTRVVRVMQVATPGRVLQPLSYHDTVGPWHAPGTPVAYRTRRSGDEFFLELTPAPDHPVDLHVEVALCPTRDARSLPDELFDRWRDVIVEGALARIYAIPDQSFSDLKLATAYSASVLTRTRRARIEASHDRVVASASVRPRPFA